MQVIFVQCAVPEMQHCFTEKCVVINGIRSLLRVEVKIDNNLSITKLRVKCHFKIRYHKERYPFRKIKHLHDMYNFIFFRQVLKSDFRCHSCETSFSVRPSCRAFLEIWKVASGVYNNKPAVQCPTLFSDNSIHNKPTQQTSYILMYDRYLYLSWLCTQLMPKCLCCSLLHLNTHSVSWKMTKMWCLFMTVAIQM